MAPPQGGFLDVGGARLHLLDRGRGPPVVLIHGLGGQTRPFRPFARAAARRRLPRRRLRSAGLRLFVACAGRHPRAGGVPGPRDPGPGSRQAADRRPFARRRGRAGASRSTIPTASAALALIAPATHPAAKTPALFRSLVIRSPLLRRLYAWTAAAPAALLARPLFFRAAFAPEPRAGRFRVGGRGASRHAAPQHLRHLDRADIASFRRRRDRVDAAALRLADHAGRRPLRPRRSGSRLAHPGRGDEAPRFRRSISNSSTAATCCR